MASQRIDAKRNGIFSFLTSANGRLEMARKIRFEWGIQKSVCFALACLFLASALFMTVFLREETLVERSLLLMLTFLMLLVGEVFPVSLTSFFAVGLMPLLGLVEKFEDSFWGFSHPVVCFILASFGIAEALVRVSLPKRLLKRILKLTGSNSRKIIGAFMLSTAVVSAMVSNVPTCAVFLSLGQVFLSIYDEEDKKRTGKTLMIGIPVASMIGGGATPAGSSINLLALALLEKHAGISISFVKWMSIGIPVCLILLPIAWFLLTKIHKPAVTEERQLADFLDKLDLPVKFQRDEKKVAIVLSVAVVFMILSSWIPSLHIALVALLACAILCLPKIGVLDTNEFLKNVNWDSIILVGTVLSLSAMLTANGTVDIVNKGFLNFTSFPPIVYLFSVALMVFILLIFIPVAPSLVAIIVPVIIQTSTILGISPEWGVFVCAICAANCYLLPLDTVCLLTYSLNYYKMTDMVRVTAPLQIATACVVTLITFSLGFWL